jgi:hypothetical protein
MVAKWKERTYVHNAPMGPKQPCSTIFTPEDKALIVAFRTHTLLPLDDGLYALQATLPYLTRSALHRCLQRHRISRLPDVTGTGPAKNTCKPYPLGSCHLDVVEVCTAEGKLYLLVAIDCISTLVSAELHTDANKTIAAQFLRHLITAVPYGLHTELTDIYRPSCWPITSPSGSKLSKDLLYCSPLRERPSELSILWLTRKEVSHATP